MTGRSVTSTAAALAAAAVALAAAPLAGAAAGQTATSSVVAQAIHASISVYRAPAGRSRLMTLSNPTPNGSPRVFLVKKRAPGWEQVYLPVRPERFHGLGARRRRRALARSVPRRRRPRGAHCHRLPQRPRRPHNGGRRRPRRDADADRHLLSHRAAEAARPERDARAVRLTLSAFSNVLYSFGGGPGQIGLHGTNTPGLLGQDVSHGCIRLPNATITALARILPLGTPVEIR